MGWLRRNRPPFEVAPEIAWPVSVHDPRDPTFAYEAPDAVELVRCVEEWNRAEDGSDAYELTDAAGRRLAGAIELAGPVSLILRP